MTKDWKQWEGQLVNGEFHLRQYLGGSDHSAVFLTERGGGEPKKAAIKLIPVDAGDTEVQLARWELAAKLPHPHLLRLFQTGRYQLGSTKLLYVVMEYAEEDLSQILPERPLTPMEARQMLQPVLNALAFLHGKRFVHGHVKPANIMAVNDQLRISSDGLCAVGQSSVGVGKPSVYDPPDGASGIISPAADIWSLGVTLVEALTQRLPVWERTEQGEPVLPETMPEPFLDIARHCLRRDPQRRWTVAEIAARLQPILPAIQKQPASPAAQKPTIARLPQKTFTKWPYLVPMAAGGLALLAMLISPKLFTRRPEAQPAPSIAVEPPQVQQKAEQSLAPPETRQPTRKSSDAKLSPSDAKPSPSGTKQNAKSISPAPASLRSVTAAKTLPGSLVQGEVLRQVLPDVSQSARNTIQGTVRVGVRVTVDPSGSVVEATLDSPGPSKYFARLAMEAARRWEFGPAKIDGQDVSSEWILRFEFRRTETKAFPVQASP